MLFCFQFQHACGITLLTGPAQAVDGTTALSVQTRSWYFVSLAVCAHNLSRITREARMSSHRFSTEDVKHAALWRENYILLFFFFFKYYSTYSIYIYIKTHYPHFTTRQAHEFADRHYLSLLQFLLSFRSTPNIHLLIIITCENPLFPPCDLFT